MIVPLLILSIVAQVYGKPQENPNINSNLHTPDDRCPPSGTHYLLPHEYDCAKFYYCEYGQRFVIPRDCAPGTHFSYERQVCVHAAQSGCTSPGQPTTSTAPPSTSTTTNAPSSTVSTVSTTPSSTTSTTTSAPSSTTTAPGGGFLPNGCPSNFNINWHLPHETDCGKFYHCVHGHKLERSCSPGLHFNPIKQVCDWPANAGCVSGGGSSTNAPSSTISTTSSIPPSTTTTTSSAPSSTTIPPGGGFLPNGCPSDFHINWHLPHETDCGKFYHCVHGQKVERSCSPGLHFNPIQKVCDWPANAGCVSGDGSSTNAPSSTVSTTSTTSPSTTSTTTSAPSSTTTPPGGGLLPNGCPSNFNINWHLPHETDCGKFYHCVHGHKLERSCSAGLHFNPIKQICDWPADAGCESGNGGGQQMSTTPSSTISTTSTAPSSSTSTTTTSAPSSPVSTSSTTPSSTTSTTTSSPSSTVSTTSTTPPSTTSTTTTSAPSSSVSTTSTTPSNTTSTTTTTSAPSSPVSPTSTTPSSTTSTTTSAPSSTTTPPGGGLLPNGCPSDFDVNWHLPHETDCGKFYHCVHGQKMERSCYPGLHFNPIKQICDWPADAGCESGSGDGQTTSTTLSSTISTTSTAPSSTTPSPTTISTTSTAPSSTTPSPITISTTSTAPSSTTPSPTTISTTSTAASSTTPSPSTISTTSAPTSPTPPGGGGNETDRCKDNCHVPHWAHETDCDKFWRCVGNQKVLGICSEGLHFNEQTQTCDFMCNVGCERKDVQTTAQRDGLKVFMPWDKVDKLIKLSKRGEIPKILDFSNLLKYL